MHRYLCKNSQYIDISEQALCSILGVWLSFPDPFFKMLCFIVWYLSRSMSKNQQNDLCAHRRLGSAWPYAESDQFSLCAQWLAKDPMIHADSEDWSDWADAQAELSFCSVRRSFYWFCHAQPHLSLYAQWVAKEPMTLQVDSEDCDQTRQMPRLIWIFTGCTGHFIGFVMRRFIYQFICMQFVVDLLYF